MSVRESLRKYSPPATKRHGARECVVRPLAMNPCFHMEQRVLWPESLLASYGEKCRRALHVNGHHVLIGNRRIFVVRDGQVFSFPPFDSVVLDVYVESVDRESVLVAIAHDSGVHVGKVRTSPTSPSELVEESFVPTSSPVARVHRLKRSLFCLCFADCRVQSLTIDNDAGGSLFTSLHPLQTSWLGAAANLLLPGRRRSYRDSFFDHPQGRLVVLSDRDLTVWTYQDQCTLQALCSSPTPSDAAALIPPSDRQSLGCLVLLTGAQVGLDIGMPSTSSSKAQGASETVVFGPSEPLPSALGSVIRVGAARGEANATVLYDDITASLVVMGRESQAPSEPVMASQINLPEALTGIGFAGRPDVGDSGIFWLYTEGPVAFRLERVSMGTRLQQQFHRSRSDAVRFLGTLPPTQRAALAMESALGGLPLADIVDAIAPLMRPEMLDEYTMSLSPGAEGFVHFLMATLSSVDQLCDSVPYWELAADLDEARRRATRTGELLKTFLRQYGWLDASGEAPRRAQWIRFHAVSETPLSEVSATHTQALFLATVLALLRHACTLAWLYGLMLTAGIGDRFERGLKRFLFDTSDPEGAEAAYVMDLLACGDSSASFKDITRRLLSEEDLLPRRAQLAVRVNALLQEKDAAGALQFTLDHVAECVRYDLINYLADLLERRAPEGLPRMRILLQQYRIDPATSAAILAVLRVFASDVGEGRGSLCDGGAVQGTALRRNLECIFADQTVPELHAVVLDWMEGHPLDDPCIELFANIIAGLDADVPLSNTLTGTFFACWRQEVRGSLPVAARSFGRLARTSLECPLSARLVCVSHARRYDPGEEDRHTEFTLLLQSQLAELLEEHAATAADNITTSLASARSATPVTGESASAPDDRPRLVVPLEQLRLDIQALTQHYLDESTLFRVAGRYHELGGASIQLDILKIHGDAPEEVTAETVLAMLTFLKAAGRTNTEGVEMVLREYLGCFEGVLPLSPFVMFLAFDGIGAGEIAKVLLSCGVEARVLFESFLGLIDTRGRGPLFPVCEILQALTDIVERVQPSQQNVCIAYLAECIRGMLAGEYRSITLTQSDVFSLKGMDAALEKRLQHNR